MNRFSVLLCLFLSATCAASALQEPLSPPTPIVLKGATANMQSIGRLIEQKQWKEAIQRFQSVLDDKTVTIAHLERLAAQYPDSKLPQAVASTKGILALGSNAGLDLKTTFPIALFAETLLPEQVADGVTYWPESRFGRELQYDTELKRLFIHLGTKHVPPVGVGRSKVVTRTVLYSHDKPQVMARAMTNKPITREFDAMRHLRGLPGVIQAEGLMVHKDPKSNQKQYTVVTKLYNSGSLQNVFDTVVKKLSFRNRLTIAHNIITGIASMHSMKYAHRDLGARNYFVNIKQLSSGRYVVCSVVADMGRTIKISDIHGGPAQGNSMYMPPEGFFYSKMKGDDYYASDIFAVGCVFWELCQGERTPWGQKCFYKQVSKDRKGYYKAHLDYINRTRGHELAKLKSRGSKLSTKDQFLSVILQMTNPDPKRRGTAKKWKEKIEAIVLKQISCKK